MKKVLILLFLFSLFLPGEAFSAIDAGGPGGCTNFLTCTSNIRDTISGGSGGTFTYTTLPSQLVNAFLPVVLGLAGFAAVIFIIISGIQFITSGGNPEAAAKARGRLIYAIIGFVIIILSFAILQIVNQLFLGTNVA